ncbi:MAG TPA: hypothetical protein PLQ13_12050 [Candidatus Krumholzibacteria bacterium]|nr:hypothetical protein [Candidatus Krumholzibacteria bacterium]
MRRFLAAGLWLAWCCACALGQYELTAHAPVSVARLLPGGEACRRAERLTRWNPRTGLLPVDKLLHEGEEALRFYGVLDDLPWSAGRQPVAPVLQVAQQREVGLVTPHR